MFCAGRFNGWLSGEGWWIAQQLTRLIKRLAYLIFGDALTGAVRLISRALMNRLIRRPRCGSDAVKGCLTRCMVAEWRSGVIPAFWRGGFGGQENC